VIDGYTQGDSTPATTADDAQENTIQSGATNAVLKIVIDGGATTNEFGLDVQSTDVTIRGLVINDFDFAGIRLDESADLLNHRMEGNFIGTDVTGATAAPNGPSGGIGFASSGSGTTIGGVAPAARNLISGNTGPGIAWGGSGPTGVDIQGNLIGTRADGISPLPNGSMGVFIRLFPDADSDINVGGTTPAAANVIAFNAQAGIGFDGTNANGSGASLLGNSIHSNDELGIDLGGFGNGVTPNDPKDPDKGDNNLQNYPVLTSAVASGGEVTVTGSLNSRPRKSFKIQFFSSPAADPSGFGEGKTFLGETTVKTNTKGKRSFTVVLTAPPAGEAQITSTATNLKTGDTSEFSQAVQMT
jgi:hypothetical protein